VGFGAYDSYPFWERYNWNIQWIFWLFLKMFLLHLNLIFSFYSVWMSALYWIVNLRTDLLVNFLLSVYQTVAQTASNFSEGVTTKSSFCCVMYWLNWSEHYRDVKLFAADSFEMIFSVVDIAHFCCENKTNCMSKLFDCSWISPNHMTLKGVVAIMRGLWYSQWWGGAKGWWRIAEKAFIK